MHCVGVAQGTLAVGNWTTGQLGNWAEIRSTGQRSEQGRPNQGYQGYQGYQGVQGRIAGASV